MICPSVVVSLLKLLVTLEVRIVWVPSGEVAAWLVGSRLEASTDSIAEASRAASPPPLFEGFEAAAWSSSDEERTESN